MNASKTLAALMLAGLTYAGAASAGHDDSPEHFDYAKVIRSTPILQIVETSRPEQVCRQEEVVHTERGRGSLAGTALGAVVGGVVGNRFGEGSGKHAMTAVGAVVGAAAGNNISRRGDRSYTTVEEHCDTVRVREQEERVVGYRVHYRYNGQDYYTRTDRDPGSKLRVRVTVTPDL